MRGKDAPYGRLKFRYPVSFLGPEILFDTSGILPQIAVFNIENADGEGDITIKQLLLRVSV